MRIAAMKMLGICALAAIAGCASSGLVGGGIDAGSNARLQRISSEIACGRPLSVGIIKDARPCAYAWKSGRIAVTTGLLGILNDEELSAAIAHEMGHLAAQERSASVAGLDGCRQDLRGELEADALGCEILKRACGLPPQTMANMLARIRMSPATDPECRPLIRERIEHLQNP